MSVSYGVSRNFENVPCPYSVYGRTESPVPFRQGLGLLHHAGVPNPNTIKR